MAKELDAQEREEIAGDVIKNLSSEIFKSGILISISIGCWDGKKRQNDRDIELQGARVSKVVYERGFKHLIPPNEIAVFRSFRMRLQNKLKYLSYDVPGMRGSRFVPIKVYQRIKNLLTHEMEEFFIATESFINRYADIQAEQIKQIRENYPSYTEEEIRTEYPTVDELKLKFYYEWFPYTWSFAEVKKVEKEAQAMMNEKAFNLIHQASLQMRQALMAEVNNLTKSMNECKNKVSLRTINSLMEKINTIKDANVFNDEEVASILSDLEGVTKMGGTWTAKEIDTCKLANRVSSIGRNIEVSINNMEENPVWACPIIKRKIRTMQE